MTLRKSSLAILMLLAAAIGSVVVFGSFGTEAEAQQAAKRAVVTESAPKAIGPYSQAIVANGFVFAAGQIGTDPKTGTLGEGIDAQVEQTLKNIAAVLKASGSSMDNIVKATVFLADINDFAKMNEIYGKHFKAPFPARSTVQVARLPRDAKVEIEVVALLSEPRAVATGFAVREDVIDRAQK